MDPLSLIGGIASTAAIIGGITKTVHDLRTLREKFNEADITLGAIISELSTVKAALYQIQDWTDYNKDGAVQRELAEALDVALTGCKECLDLLANDVAGMIGNPSQRGADILMRTRTIWNEQLMKEHQSRLHNQMSALQLLLQAVQVRTLAGQAAFIRQPRARQAIQQVKDDTSSIRTAKRESTAIPLTRIARETTLKDSSNSSQTCAESTISAPCLPNLDDQIILTKVYQNHGSEAVAKHDEHTSSSFIKALPQIEECESPTSTTSSSNRRQRPQPRLDTINLIPSPSTAVRNSPLDKGLLTPETVPRTPNQYSPATPITPGGSWGRPISSNSYQHSPLSAGSSQSRTALENKTGFMQRVKKLGRASLSPRLPPTPSISPTSPVLTANPAFRKQKRGNNRSVDVHDGEMILHPLIRAAQQGSLPDIDYLVDQGTNIEVQHESSMRTPLAIAAHSGHSDACHLLLSHGAKLEVVDHQEKTPLHLAVEHEHLEVVHLLLQNGAKTQARDHTQSTPLHMAATVGDLDVVNILVNYGADPLAKDADHQAPLHIAATNGYSEVAEVLIARNKHIDVAGRTGMTALMLAAATGKTAVVDMLLRRKASVKAKCNSGWQPLHHAAFNGHAEVVEALIRKKAVVDARTTDGRTPLMLSAVSSFSVTDLLLRKGAQLDARCSNGNQALHYACEGNAKAVIRHLLESGSSIEAEGCFARRAIHIAVANGYTDQLLILLERGADVDVRDARSERALCIAAAADQLQTLKLLLDHGAALQQSFESTNHFRESPLCAACKHGNLEIAVELIKRGAGVNERDADGWRPLRYAIHHAWPEVVEMLLANGASAASTEHAYDTSLGFTTFAPDVDGPRKERVKALLQIAILRDKAQGHISPVRETAPTPEAEGLQAMEISERPHPSPIGPACELQRQRTFHPGADSTSGIAALASALQPAATNVRRAARPAVTSAYEQSFPPVADDTYRLEWPIQKGDIPLRQPGWSQWRPQATYSKHTPSSANPQTPSRGQPTPSENVSSIPNQPSQTTGIMTQQERQQLRNMRCVACAGMNRDMPDFSCARCRQNMLREQRTEENRNVETAISNRMRAPLPIYEMPDTSYMSR